MARPEPKATRDLRKFYQAGVKILKASGGPDALEPDRKNFWGVNDDLREELKMSLNYITRARQLVRLYPTPQALDWLCRLGQRRGKPLTKSHAMVLVGIQDPKLRKTLAAQAAREGWSERRLRSETAAAAAKPRTAGKGSSPQLVSAAHAVSNTRQLAVKWLNWCDRIQRAAKQDVGRLADKEIAAYLAATEKPMRRVRDAVQEVMAISGKPRGRKR